MRPFTFLTSFKNYNKLEEQFKAAEMAKEEE